MTATRKLYSEVPVRVAEGEQEGRPEEQTLVEHFIEAEGPTFSEIVGVVWRARWLALMVASVVTAASVLIAFALPTTYTATASIVPPTSGSTNISALAAQLAPIGGSSLLGGAKSQSDLYVGILKSNTIGRDIVGRFDLMRIYKKRRLSDAVRKLAKNSIFVAGAKDGIIQIEVADRDADRARDVANAYVDELHSANERLALTDASQRRLFFQQQLDREKDALENAEVELKQTQEISGFVAPVGQTSTEIQANARTRAQIAEFKVQLSALRQSATDANPDVVRLKSEIEELERQLNSSVVATPRGREITAARLPELSLEYVRKEREVKYHETLFGVLSRQYEAARMDEAHQAPVLQVLDRAVTPDSPSSPGRWIYILAELILGIFIGSGYAWYTQRHLPIASEAP